jgi:Ca-activated chloride channel family protein
VTEVLDLLRATFARLDWAWVLLAIPAAILAYFYARKKRSEAMNSLGYAPLIARLTESVNPTARWVRAGLVVAALSATAFGLMRPQHGGVAKVIPTRGLDIVIAVDYSKSMLVDDVYPSRIDRLEAELAHFLDDARARGDRVGVVVFAGAARGMPVTSDTRLLKMYLAHADPKTENPGGTAIGKALKMSLELLLEARRGGATIEAPPTEGEDSAENPQALDEADQVIILLTDGEDNASEPLAMAEEARKLGVRIFAVGIGSKSGQPVMRFDAEGKPDGWVKDDEGNVVMTRLDEETLKTLAKETKGDYIHVAADRFGLDEVREKMAGLAAAQREDEVQIEREESYPFVVLPAFLLLCLALAISDRRRDPDTLAKEAA